MNHSGFLVYFNWIDFEGVIFDDTIDWIYLVCGQGKLIGQILKLVVQDRHLKVDRL